MISGVKPCNAFEILSRSASTDDGKWIRRHPTENLQGKHGVKLYVCNTYNVYDTTLVRYQQKGKNSGSLID